MMTQLAQLSIYHGNVTDFSPRANIDRLSKLSLQHNQITDLTSHTAIERIRELDLAQNPIDCEEQADNLVSLPRLP